MEEIDEFLEGVEGDLRLIVSILMLLVVERLSETLFELLGWCVEDGCHQLSERRQWHGDVLLRCMVEES